MRAVVFAGREQPAKLVNTAAPEPNRGEVVVDVRASGLCGSDLQLWDGHLTTTPVPQVIGHEVAGVVALTGPGVDIPVGARVAIHPIFHCGRCRLCQRGLTNICADPRILGLTVPGGFADRVTAPASALVPVPDTISLEAAAVATEAGATVHHAAISRGQFEPARDRVLVLGTGGLGTLAILLLRALGAHEVWAIDPDPVAAARAESLGAQVLPHNQSTRAIREALDGGADLALEFAGFADSIAQAVSSLDLGGRAVIAGVTPEPVAIRRGDSLTIGERTVLGTNASTRDDVVAILDLQLTGRLDVTRIITDRVTLEELPDTIERLRHARGPSVRVLAEPHQRPPPSPQSAAAATSPPPHPTTRGSTLP